MLRLIMYMMKPIMYIFKPIKYIAQNVSVQAHNIYMLKLKNVHAEALNGHIQAKTIYTVC